MKIIAFILVICLFWGAFATVKSLIIGFHRLFVPQKPELVSAVNDAEVGRQNCTDELKRLFGLYQSGALTKEEFEEVKRTVIAKHYGA